ncbi:MAG: histidine kinase [Muribaculaceae bacterium]|nr:histidine kinase [Muribaculaceae bacterium]
MLWSVMLIVPFVGMVVLSSLDNNYEFRWIDAWHVLKPLLVILLAFLIHNYFIAPILIYKHNRLQYAAMLSILLIAFVAYQCTSGPPAKPGMLPPPEQRHMTIRHQANATIPPQSRQNIAPPRSQRPRPLATPHDFTMFSLLVFSLGANLGMKLYFKSQQDEQQLTSLEKENLRQELAYLRYQVNPHFLMNTLNNIHALVDIDPSEAKSSIVHLSKFMRYLLYDSDKEYITLQQAIDLVNQYIDLMSKRYCDSVDIRFEAPEQVPNVGLAPLILMPFIENAFKHGVSYNKPSFIHMELSVQDNRICFNCINSKNDIKHEVGGVGMTNVVKRLDLIYGDQYTLRVDDKKQYSVCLTVPAHHVGTAAATKNKNLSQIY